MSGSKEEECTCHLNTNVVKYDTRSQKSHADDSSGAHEVNEKLPQNSKLEVIQKIKWGDLEDDSFPLPHENLSGSGIKFGTIRDDNMLNCRRTDTVFDAALSDSSHAKDNIPVAKVVDSDMPSNQIPSLESKEGIFVENGDSATSVEDVRGTRSGNVDGILSNSRDMNALEEGNSNESKERYRQRL